LARGIHRLFGKREFYAEEKIDGYNIRIAYQDGWILAFTRGGFVCPLTTEWAQLWWERDGLGRFFAENPEHVLCGEVTGDNPYNNQRDPRDRPGLNLQIFDIRDDRGKVYPVGKRYELVDRYGLPTVPRLGTFTAGQIDTLYERVRELNRNHREGVVLKHRNGRQHLKFVTPENELSDIEDNVPVAFDVGHPYFTNRIFRALLFVRELGLDEEEYSCRLGCAFMEGYKEVERDPEATLDYTVYCRLWDTWEQLAERIGSAVKLERLETEETELEGRGMYRIRFRRHFKKSTRRFTDMVSGRSHVD
jgi:putative ATP-dependent DNA ligase